MISKVLSSQSPERKFPRGGVLLVKNKLVLILAAIFLLGLPFYSSANPQADYLTVIEGQLSDPILANPDYTVAAVEEGVVARADDGQEMIHAAQDADTTLGISLAVDATSDPITTGIELAKTVRLAEGIDPAGIDLTFYFEIERHSFDGNTAQAHLLPQLGSSVVDGRGRMAVAINAAEANHATEGGVATLTNTVDLLAGIEFTSVGTYIWRISEIEDSSGTTLPSHVTYSQALYELRVDITYMMNVSGAPLVAEATVTPVQDDAGNVVDLDNLGFYLYAWGSNTNGQLGLGDTNPRNTPTRVGLANTWVNLSTATPGSFAINAEGHLYAWGAAWTANNMGQGGNPSPGTGNITAPTRMGTADNWTYVSARNTGVVAVNSDGELFAWGSGTGSVGNASVPTRVGTASNWVIAESFTTFALAINDQGHLYAWGGNSSGQLGLGDTMPRATPTRVGDRSDWASLSGTNLGSVIALTEGGELFAWGSGSSGRLGVGDSLDRDVPTRVGTASNWTSIGMTSNGAVAAINSAGELWTWGSASNGQLGNGTTGPSVNTPQRIGTRTDWSIVFSANSHFLAATTENVVYAWGNNADGQLGVGVTGDFSNVPIFAFQSYGFSGASRGGGTRSLALMRMRPPLLFTNNYIQLDAVTAQASLTKALQQVAGQTTSNLSFDFALERYSLDGDTSRAGELPQLGTSVVDGVGRITLDMGASGVASSTEDGITTLTRTVNLLEGIEFYRLGDFVWRISEIEGSSEAATPSQVIYSQAVYELRVEVSHWSGPGSPLRAQVLLTPLYDDEGEEVVDFTPGFPMYSWGANGSGQLGVGNWTTQLQPHPVLQSHEFSAAAYGGGNQSIMLLRTRSADMLFTNTHTRTGALSLSKTVTGNFANRNTDFVFDVRVTPTAFCVPGNVVGRVYRGNTFVREESFVPDISRALTLRDDQRLVFDNLILGTGFYISEQAHPEFRASVELFVAGAQVTIPANTLPNTALSIGQRTVGEGRNSADFTNAHVHAPPTGLQVGSDNALLPTAIACALLGVAAVVTRNTLRPRKITRAQEGFR